MREAKMIPTLESLRQTAFRAIVGTDERIPAIESGVCEEMPEQTAETPKMRVLFLDIDGVLNSHDWWRRRPSKNLHLDPVAVARLGELIRRTDARVVISSTWRMQNTIPRIVSMLTANGLPEEFGVHFIGSTPVFSSSRCRGREIASWLRMVPVHRFAILDDDSDMDPHMDRLVKTKFESGLLDSHVERVCQMLK